MTYEGYLRIMLDRLPDTYQKSPGFPVYDIVAACAMAATEISDEIETARLKLYLDNLADDELDTYIIDRSGLQREQGDFAYGELYIEGSGKIPVGTVFSTPGGLTFASTEDVSIEDDGYVPVAATGMGDKYNVAADTITRFPMTLQGFSSVTNPVAFTGGADEETDDAYRERYRDKMSHPPINGNIYAYRDWALEVDGVGGVKVEPLGHGPGTVDIKIANSSGSEPSEDLIKAVQNYIDPGSTGKGEGVAPIGANCYVSGAVFETYDISGKITLDGSIPQESVDEDLQQRVASVFADAFTTGYLRYSDVAEAVLHASGVKRFSGLSVGSKYEDIDLTSDAAAKVGEWSMSYDFG